jgi:hypothetical protein
MFDGVPGSACDEGAARVPSTNSAQLDEREKKIHRVNLRAVNVTPFIERELVHQVIRPMGLAGALLRHSGNDFNVKRPPAEKWLREKRPGCRRYAEELGAALRVIDRQTNG